MAIEIDFATKVITVPQADCTLVSGTFYRLPTKDTFKAQVGAIMDNEEHIWMDYPIDHNPEYTVAGITYASKVEIVNGYTVEFTPNSAWSVELTDSNNNLWDIGGGVLVQNQVQVIPTNAAGLQVVATSSGVTAQDKTDIITGTWMHTLEGTMTARGMMRIMMSVMDGEVYDVVTGGDVTENTTTIGFRNMGGSGPRTTAQVNRYGGRSNIMRDET